MWRERDLEDESRELFVELIRYLELRFLNPEKAFPASVMVDDCWHAFILSTHSYAAFCHQHNNGAFLHHSPGMFDSRNENDPGYAAYGELLDKYAENFNFYPSATFWDGGMEDMEDDEIGGCG